MIGIKFITVACEGPRKLAAFWAAALDGDLRELPPTIDPVIVERSGDGPALLFKELPKGTTRDLPIHLDLSTSDREATVERLCDLGAAVRETKTETVDTQTATWTVMEDPEGNRFCVSEYQ
ncbi:VOC family protein [Natrinema halophilum]|uniref:VOC family protein n=1 Tax=Natrinema halophilum TaxID=1699371 RepID=A0A7D5GUF5_9EURY|nr:VOC family protein [Natrinema halophilum]QLG50026.1 glyoxalase [Natrinema halophilum]